MKRTFKKLIGLMLVIALLIVPAANTVTAVNGVTEETENPYNKLHFYLDNEENYTIDSYSELVQATASLKTNAATYALTNTEDTAESELHVTVEFASNFMETAKYQEFLNERETLETIDEVHEWRARLNAYSKEFHENLVAKNMKSLSDMEYSDYDVIGYSPFVVLRTSPDDISTAALLGVASCAGVEHVSVAYEAEAVADATWEQSLDGANAFNVVQNSTYTGSGVRIGIYEAEGICETNHINLANKNIIVNQSAGTTTSPHATSVTSIIALMAPDAQLYVSKTDRMGIEWFIQQGCDIVNCSFGYHDNIDNGDGTYSVGERDYRFDIDGVYDYQIKANCIIVVVSAGNIYTNNTEEKYNPYAQITSPGYAMNAITVGGSSYLYYSGWNWYKSDTSAAYVCPGEEMKPNISASYSVSIPNIGGVQAGTSFASPIVTACIAMLCEKVPSYKVFPERVCSLITATAQKVYDYSNDNGEFDDVVGAGMINLEGMLYASNNYISINNTNSQSGVEIISENVYMNAGDEIQIGLMWLIANGNFTDDGNYDKWVSGAYLTNYNLRLYDPYGNLIASSNLIPSNVELIRKTVSTTGTYRIVAYQNSNKNAYNPNDPISLSYMITGV
ncbi:MAG: S8 family serine peptidase [Clostridia bacterium]|nr:S8 family serine peptidase [Clostridia bacterium]